MIVQGKFPPSSRPANGLNQLNHPAAFTPQHGIRQGAHRIQSYYYRWFNYCRADRIQSYYQRPPQNYKRFNQSLPHIITIRDYSFCTTGSIRAGRIFLLLEATAYLQQVQLDLTAYSYCQRPPLTYKRFNFELTGYSYCQRPHTYIMSIRADRIYLTI